MELETQKKIEEMDQKLNAIYATVEKTRKYFLVTMWVTLAMVVLPILGLLFIIPAFLNTYTSTLEGLI
jgi:hypothetical protein